MLRRAANPANAAKLLMFCIFVGIVVVLFWLTQAAPNVAAQEGRSRMNELLEQVRNEELTFQFAVPLIADQRFWTVPDGLNDGPEDETTIQIEEIGDDYVCFRVRSGQAIDVICTPFSNIASISYLDMPE